MASRACAYELGKFLQCQHLLLMVEFQLPPVLPHVCPSFLLPPIMADCPPPPLLTPHSVWRTTVVQSVCVQRLNQNEQVINKFFWKFCFSKLRVFKLLVIFDILQRLSEEARRNEKLKICCKHDGYSWEGKKFFWF